ncbi:PDDEXK nuclease domain-containing protein [Methanoplanus limicola]|uniref:DUF1016 domain-containing protein n=1 Tax=Methanoplanus limicola DSM 2279 TaxID=937775 RepID=H1Z081_9EURY|nr:PDDEXK nuclease domain-containing protein [Methanoplanus limicola]EHQ36173.1 protein of unknown function DUF1016 [Methanoplanus limicola DSM 2279]
MEIVDTKEYNELIYEIKSIVRTSRTQAVASVNRGLINMYFWIGKNILLKQEKEGWGKSVVDCISSDLLREFPEMKGFSARNLWRMRQFARVHIKFTDLPQPVAEIPWGHNMVIIEKIKSTDEREFYIIKTIENGWSRNVLIHQIESDLYSRTLNAQKKSVNNIRSTLPEKQSELAVSIMKDPLCLEFLGVSEDVKERELQRSLIFRLKDFLIELGKGFAFVGSEYRLSVGGEDFFIDLLFYHTKLHCYVVIELKIDSFKPEYAGKLNFYLSAVDDLLRDIPADNPTIGLLLCKERNDIVAEYALRDLSKPMGISTYYLKTPPEEMEKLLPTVKELQGIIEDDE